MTAQHKGERGNPPSPASQRATVRMTAREWHLVEAFAPSEADVVAWFGKHPPAQSRIESIQYFAAVVRHHYMTGDLAAEIEAIDRVGKTVKAARAAALTLRRQINELTAMPEGDRAVLPFPGVMAILASLRTDLELLEYGLRAPTAPPAWQIIAEDALSFVIDPAIRSIGRDARTSAAGSRRVSVLVHLLAACGVTQERTGNRALPITAGMIREWLESRNTQKGQKLEKRKSDRDG
ncbi:hypothetical protein AruPA_15280 [Acidiphilium sp. PA]|uniref:hypothetical protein n=1 Tax=Acidiphilium sp. PA TaxID=2871705 RepID=UPI002242E836|nr:hypothetical protein [Acidiphilium sp. PA]MCW8308400.1 hypothetical protein [Acidiphilium sp. PA]